VNVVFGCLSCCFCRRLEEGTHVDVKTQICKAGSDNFGTAVMAVLSQLSHHDTRPSTFLLCKCIGHLPGVDKIGVEHNFAGVDTTDGVLYSLIASKSTLHGKAYFAQASPRACSLNGQCQEVVAAQAALVYGLELLLYQLLIAVGAQLLQPLDLALAYGRIVYFKNINISGFMDGV